MKNCSIFLLFMVILIGTTYSGFSQDPLSIVKGMISTTSSFQSLQFILESKERVDDKIIREVNFCRLNANPYKIYALQSVPVKKLEILYVTGMNGGKVKIYPASFPWVTLNLHPENPLMLNNHHHPVLEAGFGFISSMIENFIRKSEKQKAPVVEKFSKVNLYGSECYIITLACPDYKLSEYVVPSIETPLTLSRKLQINYYSILENNPGLKVDDKLKPGKHLTIPNEYATRIELYIHRDNLYPIDLKIYDRKGLFEQYTFTKVVINPAFSAEVFSPDNPEYRF